MSKNKEAAVRWFKEVWNDKSQACIRELVDPEMVGHMEGGVDKLGPEGMIELQQEMLRAFPGVTVEVLEAISEGETTFVHWEASVPASPSVPGALSFHGMTRMRFSNGKIVEGWDCWNMGGVLARLASVGA